MAWGTELKLAVTPEQFTENEQTYVVVNVTQTSNGQPVSGATVIIYYVSMDNTGGSNPGLWTGSDPINNPSSHSFTGGQGTTNSSGVWTTTMSPKYGSGHVHMFIQATAGNECGYNEYTIKSASHSGDNPLINALGRSCALGIVMFIVLIITGALWYGSTGNIKKNFDKAKLAGFNKKFENEKSDKDKLGHVGGQDIFERWKQSLRESKDAKLFVPSGLLRSFIYKGSTKYYAGVVRGDEEVEYSSTDSMEQRVSEPYKLYTDPQPKPPEVFTTEDDVQIYPVAEKIDTCSRCTGAGKIKCGTCSGDGKVKCNICGNGKVTCTSCGGTGSKVSQGGGSTTKYVDQYGHTTRTETGAGATVHSTCFSCKGTGMVNCMKCGGTALMNCPKCKGSGKVICDLCEGDKQTRHLSRKIWTYKHERLRDVAGPEGLKAGPERFDEIADTLWKVPGDMFDDACQEIHYPSQTKDATPTAETRVDECVGFHDKWEERSKGKVVKDDWDILISPVTKCESEYPAKEGQKRFRIWAFGNPRAWVMDAGETPTKLTARLALRHVAFGAVIVLEMAFFAYIIVFGHVLG